MKRALKKFFRKIQKNKQGYSLVEVMAATAIIATVSATGAMSAGTHISKQKISATMAEMKEIYNAVEQYHISNPGATFSSFTSSLVNTGYLPRLFTQVPESSWKTDWGKDAFGNSYKIKKPTAAENGLLTSCGQDGICFEDLDDEEKLTFPDADKDNISMELSKIVR
ncbi:MAG: hypothetical protein UW24_C0006G0028 [Parcubacteria group bacterium GW2011_GWA2_44_12]|nr:MAG: hypothetical protein UW24_C0006G0028 [Parcubacteria group bacterium GW2011_GWA2_44_12]